MNDLISVIIPVYNVEKYLDRCLETITDQTYKELEIILVDDGSTDSSGRICDKWSSGDSRIRVIHQENKGAGYARNTGLAAAVGEYICFVDSDDYIAPDMFSFLHDLFIDGIDIAECMWCNTADDHAELDPPDTPYNLAMYSSMEAMRGNINDTVFRQVIWNKMYRREVVSGIRFPVGRKIDDEFWTYQVIARAGTLIRTDKVLYAYRQQNESVMHVFNAQKSLEAIEAKVMRHKYICSQMPELEADSLLSVWQTCIYQGQQAVLKMKKEDRAKLFSYISCILSKYPMRNKLKDMSVSKKQKAWLKAAEADIYGVCRLRCILRIGI